MTTPLEQQLAEAEATIRALHNELAESNRGIVALNLELDERVEARTAELARANELLREEIAQRERAETALRESNRRKDEFLAMLSHELRNPLASIGNSLHLINKVDPASDMARQAKNIINRQFGVLSRLVNDLLDVTRISRGKIHLQLSPVELGSIVARTLDDHRPQFAAAGVELSARLPERPVPIQGDDTRLVQVVGNLLDNAVKFSERGGRVELSLECNDSDKAVIRVRDSGMGIEAQLLPEIFEPFVQADQGLDRSRSGLGLGLALVKALTEMHGGTVEASSEGLGKGAEFAIHLPLSVA